MKDLNDISKNFQGSLQEFQRTFEELFMELSGDFWGCFEELHILYLCYC